MLAQDSTSVSDKSSLASLPALELEISDSKLRSSCTWRIQDSMSSTLSAADIVLSEAFNVGLVFALLGLSSEGLILGFLIGFLTNDALVIIVADEFDDMGWIDGIASLVGIHSDHAEMHVIAGRKGCNKDISILLIR